MENERRPVSTGSFVRGAEIWMHQCRLALVACRNGLLVAVSLGMAAGTLYFFGVTDERERAILWQHVIAQIRFALDMTAGPMDFELDGHRHALDVDSVIRLTTPGAERGEKYIRDSIYVSAASSLGVVFLVVMYWWAYGRAKMQDKHLRGASLVDGKVLADLLRRREDASPYLLAGVPMRARSETLHTLIAGAQGTGKSQQFFALMRQVRERGRRMIVYDPTGEYTQAFYREGKDILMNPLDARSPNWNVWNEISREYHFDNMASGLIQEPPGSDPFWALAGRMVFKDVVQVLGEQGKRTNRGLYDAIAKSNLQGMFDLLKGTAGASYVDPMTERTGMSIKMTIQNQLEAFRFLHDKGEPFSIRQWIHEEGDSWMFITARESMREALKPILTLWIDTAIKAVLDLEPIHRERCWLALDELATLQKLEIMRLASTNTRKYGLCMVLGIHDIPQMCETYGKHLASTIISGCQTKLLLRVTDGEAAKLLSELMGQVEVAHKDETLSYGLSAQRDGVSVNSRRSLRELVLTSEILTLPDMHAFLMIPGDYPLARVAYDYVPSPAISRPFVERKGFGVAFSGGAGQPSVAARSASPDEDCTPTATVAEGVFARNAGPKGSSVGPVSPKESETKNVSKVTKWSDAL